MARVQAIEHVLFDRQVRAFDIGVQARTTLSRLAYVTASENTILLAVSTFHSGIVYAFFLLGYEIWMFFWNFV